MGYVDDIRKKIGHDMLMLVGAGVFVYKDGRVLLQRRRDNLCWAPHAGCMEIGEDLESAAKRELFEETGLLANNLTFLGVFSGEDMIYTYPNGDRVQITGAVYVCEDFSGEVAAETDEALELKWFPVDQIPDDISPPDKKSFQAFQEYIRDRK